jgi:hypothetical protein
VEKADRQFSVFSKLPGSFVNKTVFTADSAQAEAPIKGAGQTGESAVVKAFRARFVANDEFQRAGVVGQGAEREPGGGDAVNVVFSGVEQCLAARFAVEEGGFQFPDTQQTAVSRGHRIDQRGLDFGLWLKFLAEGGPFCNPLIV